MHTFVGQQLGELDELALFWSRDQESHMDLESPMDHVDARANLLGCGFSLLTISYVFDELRLFFLSSSARYDFTAVFYHGTMVYFAP